MNCPNCGARVTGGAEWCGLCQERLDVVTEPNDVVRGYDDTGYGPRPDRALGYVAGQDNGWVSGVGSTAEPGYVSGAAERWAAPGVAASVGPEPQSAAAAAWGALGSPHHYGTPQAPEAAYEPVPATDQYVAHAQQGAGDAGLHEVAATTLSSASRLGDHTIRRMSSGELQWQCGTCGGIQSMDAIACRTCGTSLFSAEKDDKEALTADPTLALVWSVVPGGGQWYVGERLQALARLATVLLAAAAALSFPQDSAVGVMRWVLLAMALGLWLVAAYDARLAALGAPGDALLGGRRLVWVTAGILGVLVASVFLALAMGALSSGAGA